LLKGRAVSLARVLRHRYVAVGLVAFVAFLSVVAVAFAYLHWTNGVYHGLEDRIFGSSSYPYGRTEPNATYWSSVAVRHYFDDGSYHQQCERFGWGNIACQGTGWGTAPCQKRYVGGVEGRMARHWVRWQSPPCGGQMHG
jgi:hypothetical protein